MKRAVAALGLCLLLSSCGSDEETSTDDTGAQAIPAATVPAPLPSLPQATPAVPPGEALGARLARPTALHAAPGGRRVARLATRTEFGSRRVLAVVAQRGGWLEVLSPSMPNGRTGWIPAADVTLLRETWSIEIDLSSRRMTVRHQGEVYRRMAVAVGADATPTPPGRYGVTDRLRTASHASPYGCCVLALSGRQPNIPQDWSGGDRLAIHGTSQPASIGTAASHGCIRAGAEDMRLLMARIPLGAPVLIRR